MTYIKAAFFLLYTFLVAVSINAQAGTMANNVFKRPFYIGVLGGYGSTTWQGLVPTASNQNLAISISTPLNVTEGGGVWGGLAGYEISPYFALETSYVRYPNANITFDEISLFSFANEGETEFNTYTETLSLMGKVMLVIPNTKVRIYSGVGVAGLHRDDVLIDSWRLTPTFGAGFNYHFTDHFMGEAGGIYTAGYGESRLNPTISYFPFLYALTLRLDYFF